MPIDLGVLSFCEASVKFCPPHILNVKPMLIASHTAVINSCQLLFPIHFFCILLSNKKKKKTNKNFWQSFVHRKCPWVCERCFINQMCASPIYCAMYKWKLLIWVLLISSRVLLLPFVKIPFKMLQVFKNLQLFMEDKEPEDDLFDRLNVSGFSPVCLLLRIPSKMLMLYASN